jgi:hypothetical protein
MTAPKTTISLVPRRAGRALVRLYRATLSPIIGFHCRHVPTCSQYGDGSRLATPLPDKRMNDPDQRWLAPSCNFGVSRKTQGASRASQLQDAPWPLPQGIGSISR